MICTAMPLRHSHSREFRIGRPDLREKAEKLPGFNRLLLILGSSTALWIGVIGSLSLMI
jgi:hypothetical protein